MRNDKSRAVALRKEGKSYSEISKVLQIPTSTLSNWFSNEEWSVRIKERLTQSVRPLHTVRLVQLNIVRNERLVQAYQEAREEAKQELERLKYNPLFIAGLMLYWGEGDKVTKHWTRLINTDPKLIRIFVFFLENICLIRKDKIKASLLVYPDLDEVVCRNYWAEQTGIALERFTKSTQILGRHPTRRTRHGMCTVVVSSAYFKAKVLEWIKLLPEQLIDKGYYENI